MSQPPPNDATPVIAIVLAGGSGVRFGATIDGATANKVLIPIGDQPVLAYSLTTFQRNERVNAIIVVARDGDEAVVADIVTTASIDKLAAVVTGGATRQGSEWAGLQAAAELDLRHATVLLHDAARPFLTTELLDRILDDESPTGTIPTTPIEEPIVDAQGRPRPTDHLMRVQTPQAFPLDLLLEVYPQAEAGGFTGVDSAETVQHVGAGSAQWVRGDPRNIKVTHPDDRAEAERLASRFVDGRWRSPD